MEYGCEPILLLRDLDADPARESIVRRRKSGESSADHRDGSQRDFERMGRSGSFAQRR